ncbi:hypothetical protein Tco_0140863 [Tanacetum coccineum]
MSIQDMEDLKQHYLDEMKSLINDLQIKDYRNERIDIQYRRECEIKIYELKQNFNGMSIEIRKKEKELLQQEQAAYNISRSDSLIMEDKHLDTIPEPKSDELIKSSIEDLVHTPSESDGIFESECDLPICDYSSPKKDEVLDDIISIPLGNGNDHFNAESSLIESVLNRDNLISSAKIDFLLEEFAGELALIAPIPPGIVEADFDPKGDIHFIEKLMYDNSFFRPPETLKDDSETLVSLEVVEIVIPEVGGIDTDILLTIKDDILCEKLLNVNLLIVKIEALKDNPIPSSDFMTNSGSPTSYSNISLPDYTTFFCDNEPDLGNFTMDVVEDISDNPTRELYVHVLPDLPTHPTLQLDSDFTLSRLSLMFEASRARGFCPSITRASHPQLHFGNPIS